MRKRGGGYHPLPINKASTKRSTLLADRISPRSKDTGKHAKERPEYTKKARQRIPRITSKRAQELPDNTDRSHQKILKYDEYDKTETREHLLSLEGHYKLDCSKEATSIA